MSLIRIGDHLVGAAAVFLPDGALIKRPQARQPRGPIRETAQPHKSIRRTHHPELAQHSHPHGLLRLDEVRFEIVDKVFALAWLD